MPERGRRINPAGAGERDFIREVMFDSSSETKGSEQGSAPISYVSSEWKEIRQKALERDGEVCRVCGGDGSDSRLEVHHIIKDTDDPNSLLNLATLCVEHHRELEGKPLYKMQAKNEAIEASPTLH